MKVIVDSDEASEEEFRSNKELSGPTREFFESQAGAMLLYLLKQKAKVKSKDKAVPSSAIENYFVAELSRLAGIQEIIDLIERVCKPIAKTDKKTSMPQLGVKENLPPEFQFNKEAAAKAIADISEAPKS